MTEATVNEARNYLREAANRAKERGQSMPTSGPQFERAVKTAARSFDQLHKAARLAAKNTGSDS
jgi:hypothetical protein